MEEPDFSPGQYDEFAEKYNGGLDQKPYNAYYERPAMLELLPELSGKTIMDAGCGNGWYSEHFANSNASVTIVDASEKMLANASDLPPLFVPVSMSHWSHSCVA